MNTYRLVPLGDCSLEQYREIPDDQLFSVLSHSHFRDKTKTWSFVPEEWDIEKGKSPDSSESLKLEQSVRPTKDTSKELVEKSSEESGTERTMIEKSLEELSEEPVKVSSSPEKIRKTRRARKIAQPFSKSYNLSNSPQNHSDSLDKSIDSENLEGSTQFNPITQSYQFPSDYQLESPGLRKRKKNSLQKSNNIVQVNVQKLRGGSIMDLRQIYDQAQLIQAKERPDHESDSDSEADLDNAVKQLAEDDNDNWIQGCGCQLNLNSLVTITQMLIGVTIIIFCVYKLVVDTSSDSQTTYASLLALVVGAFLPGRIDGNS